jgi:hypothetical protein
VGHARLRTSPSAPAPRRVTERDRDVLAFLAEHRLVLASQVRELLGVSDATAGKRVRALVRQGFIESRPIFGPATTYCRIRPLGLAAIGSDLPPTRLKLACYEHDVGVAWIWLAAKRGAFGPLREVVGERRLRSRDGFPGLARDGDEPAGVRLGGVGRGGRERLHYPDLLLITHDGKRVAIELELSSKGRARLQHVLLGYAGDTRIDGVLYLVADHRAGNALGHLIRGRARRLGLDEFVAVRRLRVNASPSIGRGREVVIVDRRPGRARVVDRHARDRDPGTQELGR